MNSLSITHRQKRKLRGAALRLRISALPPAYDGLSESGVVVQPISHFHAALEICTRPRYCPAIAVVIQRMKPRLPITRGTI